MSSPWLLTHCSLQTHSKSLSVWTEPFSCPCECWQLNCAPGFGNRHQAKRSFLFMAAGGQNWLCLESFRFFRFTASRGPYHCRRMRSSVWGEGGDRGPHKANVGPCCPMQRGHHSFTFEYSKFMYKGCDLLRRKQPEIQGWETGSRALQAGSSPLPVCKGSSS